MHVKSVQSRPNVGVFYMFWGAVSDEVNSGLRMQSVNRLSAAVSV